MKNKIAFPVLMVLAALLFLGISSCTIEDPVEPANPECEDGWGKLLLENISLHTVQQINISGTNYGTLDPGEEKTIALPVGDYSVSLNGVSGGSGCGTPSNVHIPDCGTVGRNCSF